MKFVIHKAKTKDGKPSKQITDIKKGWYFTLVAKNGKVLMTSEIYVRRESIFLTISSIKYELSFNLVSKSVKTYYKGVRLLFNVTRDVLNRKKVKVYNWPKETKKKK